MLPRVILFNAMSVDGRLDNLESQTDLINLYYELASQWEIDAVLMGSSTVLKGFNAQDCEIRGDVLKVRENRETLSPDQRPLLVVPDSKGKIGIWAEVLEMPFIKDIIVLCSHSTPHKYIDFLKENQIEYLITGEDQVSLENALMILKKDYDIKKIRVDSGGTLNGALLRAGLVDDIRLLINPCLVGGISISSIFQAPDLKSSDKIIKLELKHLEKLKGDVVYLQYLLE